MNTIVSIVGKALVAGLTLALIAAPVAAQAADADVGIVITRLRSSALGSGDSDANKITIGQTKTLTLTLTNAGPSAATGVKLAKPTLDPKLTMVKVIGCALQPVAGVIDPTLDLAWPCTVGTVSDVAGANTAVVSIDVKYTDKTADVAAIPADYPKHLPTVCPSTDAAFAMAPVAVSITSTTVDPNPANDTATRTFATASIADVGITIAIPTFVIGQPSTITVTATNKGPCPANDVWVSDFDGSSAFVPAPPNTPVGTSTLGTWVFVSSSGDADAVDGTGAPLYTPNCEAIWDGCEFGPLASGASATQTLIYTPQPMPSNDLMQTAYPFGLNGYSGLLPYDFGSNLGQTLDPILDDNKVVVKHIVSKDVSGCSTGGVPGALGLLLVGLATLTRRRR